MDNDNFLYCSDSSSYIVLFEDKEEHKPSGPRVGRSRVVNLPIEILPRPLLRQRQISVWWTLCGPVLRSHRNSQGCGVNTNLRENTGGCTFRGPEVDKSRVHNVTLPCRVDTVSQEKDVEQSRKPRVDRLFVYKGER